MIISGQYTDLFQRRTFPAEIDIRDGKIYAVKEVATAPDHYILPGFTDAHIHIESSMLTPAAFGTMAVVHGTVATVSDPHEIANVCGVAGVQYMIENARHTPLKIFFGAPSCVPATEYETSGATLDADAVQLLLESPDIWYLSEMMNYPGVLNSDPEVMKKIAAAVATGKPIDGHAPGLKGVAAQQYAAAGITTDHECVTLDEALDKIAAGMQILIREGSAAKNFDALHELIRRHPDKVMFCCDDKHPDELALHHINHHVKKALRKGHNLYDVLRAACVNPVMHYKLPVGLLRPGDAADFIIVNDLKELEVLETWINGKLVAEGGESLLPHQKATVINNFHTNEKKPEDFSVNADGATMIRVIEATDGQLITKEITAEAKVDNGKLVSDTGRDLLKMAVVNRYTPDAPVAVAFIKNIGLKSGAIASTVAHDCHNIVAVGADDESLCAAVNALIKCKGGIAVAQTPTEITTMPLPVAGLMSDKGGTEVAKAYTKADAAAKALGTKLKAPFMTLSFMSLLVIPSLKLSDKGLFDGNNFAFTNLTL